MSSSGRPADIVSSCRSVTLAISPLILAVLLGSRLSERCVDILNQILIERDSDEHRKDAFGHREHVLCLARLVAVAVVRDHVLTVDIDQHRIDGVQADRP